MTRRLMVIASEWISDWINKGEVIDRYYNPGDLFDEVHLVLLNDDAPDPGALQRMGGRATVHVHNLPSARDLFLRTLGWRPALLRQSVVPVVRLAEELQPSLIRCYGAHLNAFAAREVKRHLGTPYVVSVHVNPDEDLRGRARTLRQRVTGAASVSLERVALRGADLVLPVYRPIVPYLERMGVSRYSVAYNVLNADHLVEKTDYRPGQPIRIVSVGRQFPAKDPTNILRAVAGLPQVHLDLVGDGELHGELRALSDELGLSDRVRFEPVVANDVLCQRLPTYDLFVIHTEFWELSKALLEALLCGLPVIVNRRVGQPVPELTEDLVVLVDNTELSYRSALSALLDDDSERERLGRRARALAADRWHPVVAEQRFVEHYRHVLGSSA